MRSFLFLFFSAVESSHSETAEVTFLVELGVGLALGLTFREFSRVTKLSRKMVGTADRVIKRSKSKCIFPNDLVCISLLIK